MPPKSSLFILVTCFFMHARNSRLLIELTTSEFQNKFPPDKVEDKFSVSMNYSPAGNRMLRRGTLSSTPEEEPLCKKNTGNQGAKSGSEDHNSSLHKALLNETKPEDSSWSRINAKTSNPSMFNEEDFMQTDYQPPCRKSPIHN